MNLLLMKAGLIPATIKHEYRRTVYCSLAKADEGFLNEFILFICDAMNATYRYRNRRFSAGLKMTPRLAERKAHCDQDRLFLVD